MKLSPTQQRYRVKAETFETLQTYCAGARNGLDWPHPFVLPAWMGAWWQIFGRDYDPYICSFRQGEELLGIAPLMHRDGEARFIGNAAVIDYSDFVICSGREAAFFEALIDDLRQRGILRLHLHGLRPDSTVLTHLLAMGRSLDCRMQIESEDVTVELQLPRSWSGYLDALSGKQRHEVRRKLRRLKAAGDFRFRTLDANDDLGAAIDTFLSLFGLNREDKAAFMTPKMNIYFRTLANAMAEHGLLKLGFLEVDRSPVAAVMCFDYRNRRYLYNSGYDRHFSDFSVGLLSKIMSIADAIESGRRIYDFLRGDEPYKLRLGGQHLPVCKCLIEL